MTSPTSNKLNEPRWNDSAVYEQKSETNSEIEKKVDNVSKRALWKRIIYPSFIKNLVTRLKNLISKKPVKFDEPQNWTESALSASRELKKNKTE